MAGFLVVLLVVCGLASMVWNASRERGLVVDAFSVPPELAQTGMTGSVVANRLIDKLGRLQAASFSVIQGGETYRRDGGGGVRVEIPDTGISLDELQRYLRDWLGHETHATGEVVRTAKGWSLTVRYGDEPGATLDGADLDVLIGQGAERLLAQALPYRYAEYLSRHGRFAEALALLPSIAPRGGAVERGRAFSTWATVYFYQGDMARAAQKAQQGLDADPDNPTLYGYLAAGASNLGHDETGWSAAAGVPSHMGGEVVDSLDPAVAAVLPILFGAYRAELAGDYDAAVAGWARLSGMDTSAYDPGSAGQRHRGASRSGARAPDRRDDPGERPRRQAQLRGASGADDDPGLRRGRLGRRRARGRGYGCDLEKPVRTELGRKNRLRLAAMGRVDGARRGDVAGAAGADREDAARLRRLRAQARAHRRAEA